MNTLMYVFLIVALIWTSQARVQMGKCECKPFLECPKLWSLTRTYQGRRTIHTYICQTDKPRFKVCCPVNDVTFDVFPRDCGLPQKEAAQVSERILGGTTAPMGGNPWIAALLYLNVTSGKIQALCAGSLINARYVLTAAHCVTNTQHRLVSIRLGEWDMGTEIDCIVDTDNKQMCAMKAVDFEIERITNHEKYHKKRKHWDIALVRLKQSVDFSTTKGYISPVCLPTNGWNAQFHMGRRTPEAIGWGRTDVSGQSNRLQRVELPFAPFSWCRHEFEGFRRGTLCVGGEKGKDTCSGDSGGPLTLKQLGRKYLIGIVSYGRGCGTKRPAVYTDVALYKSWIRHNIMPW